MPRCTWELIPRQGTLKGTEICTLTGRACIIDNPKERPSCSRAAQIRAFQAKHYPDDRGQIDHSIVPKAEPGIQAELPI